MNISTLSIKRYVATYLIFITLIFMGLYFSSSMKVSFYPDFSAPVLIVLTPYMGATPLQVEENLTKIIEKSISSAEGIDNIESTSSEGLSMIIVRLRWDVNVKKVKDELRERIDIVMPQLPREIKTPTILEVQNLLPPSLLIGVESNSLSHDELKKFVEDKILFHFQKLKDAGYVEVLGGEDKYVAIVPQEEKLREYSIKLSQIERAIASENIDFPAGTYRKGEKEFLLRVKGKFSDIKDLKSIPIAFRGEKTVFLKDIAYVGFHKEEPSSIFRLNGKRTLVISIRKKNDGNSVRLCNEGKETLKELSNKYPFLKFSIVKDESIFIKNSIKTVLKNALYGGILAALIILLFLRDLKGTIIISVSIPSALIASFVLMKIFNLSINTISLGGLAIAVGMVVDASIVVLENIERNLEIHKKRDFSVFETASKEVTSAVIASVLTSIVVFLPMAFLKGMASVLLGELALTVVFSLLFSALVSLSLIPVLSYDFLTPKEKEGRISLFLKNFIENIVEFYKKIIAFSIKNKKTAFNVVGLSFFIFFISFFPLRKIDFTMLPEVDQGEYRIDYKLTPGVSVVEAEKFAEKLENMAKKFPHIENIYSVVGKGFVFGDENPAIGYIYIKLKNTKERESINFYIKKTREIVKKNRFPELVSYTVKRIEPTEGMIRPPIDLNIYGDDLKVLKDITNELIEKLKMIPGVVDLESSIEAGKPEIAIYPERELLNFYRFTTIDLGKQLKTYYGTLSLSKIDIKDKTYPIKITRRLKSLSPEKFELLLGSNSVLQLPYLSNFLIKETPQAIKRFNFQRFAEIKGELAFGKKRELKKKVAKIIGKMQLPEGYSIQERGASRAVTDSFKTLGVALMIAIFLVYVVMASQFNSFLQPFIISFTIPLSMIGIFWGLYITKTPLSLNSFLGIIVLAGIVVNNGILLIDFINQKLKKGLPLKEAVIEGSRLRVRPILMTAMTTIFGMLPLALSQSTGSESLKPLAITVVSGLLTSTLLTPIIIPSLYYLFKKEN